MNRQIRRDVYENFGSFVNAETTHYSLLTTLKLSPKFSFINKKATTMTRLTTMLLLLMCIAAHQMSAQTRYLNQVFDQVEVTPNITYGVNATVLYNSLYGEAIPEALLMDIYRPVGDTAINRPVVFYFHTGNFGPFKTRTRPARYRTVLMALAEVSAMTRQPLKFVPVSPKWVMSQPPANTVLAGCQPLLPRNCAAIR